jgi:hypothetical protein
VNKTLSTPRHGPWSYRGLVVAPHQGFARELLYGAGTSGIEFLALNGNVYRVGKGFAGLVGTITSPRLKRARRAWDCQKTLLK